MSELRDTYNGGKTKSLVWRKKQLKNIVRMHEENTDAIAEAIRQDLGGAKIRGIFDMDAHTEALKALKHLDKWTADAHVSDDSFMGSAFVRKEPKGVVLLISPWNFPISLVMRPLVSIIAAGNCCVIKPSEISAHSAKLIEQLITKYMDPSAVRVVQGEIPETTALLKLKYDHMYVDEPYVRTLLRLLSINDTSFPSARDLTQYVYRKRSCRENRHGGRGEAFDPVHARVGWEVTRVRG